MRLGMIGRADDGGLGVMTQEIARHLRPDRVLVARLEGRSSNREGYDPERLRADGSSSLREESWDGGTFADSALRWLTDEVDAVYTAETTYDPRLAAVCSERGVRLYVHVMPELFGADVRRAQEQGASLLLPTSWERERVPDARLLPVPVAGDRLPGRVRSTVRTLLHPSAPAMLDRNGTELVREAIGQVRQPCTLLVSGPEAPAERTRVGVVDVVPVGHRRDYWSVYENADALLLPRRYGGLSLPMQEAASLGMPVVTTNLAPQNEWAHFSTMVVPDPTPRSATMKGGRFDVWSVDRYRLAATIDALLSSDDLAAAASEQSLMHAARLDWSRMTAIWRMDLSL